MNVISGSRKGTWGNPGPVTPDTIASTDTIESYINETCVRICLTDTKNVFESVIDLTMSPQEALILANKLIKKANKLRDDTWQKELLKNNICPGSNEDLKRKLENVMMAKDQQERESIMTTIIKEAMEKAIAKQENPTHKPKVEKAIPWYKVISMSYRRGTKPSPWKNHGGIGSTGWEGCY